MWTPIHDDVTDDEARKIRDRAIYSAKRLGFGEYSEDLAQEVLLNFAEGHGRHQTIDQAVIDAIRHHFGRPGTPGFARRKALIQAQQIDGLACEIPHPITPGSAPGDGIDFDRIVNRLGGIERALVVLRYQWGFLEKEIGYCFGVTESRIAQRFASVEARLSRNMAFEERQQSKGIFPQVHEESEDGEPRTLQAEVEGMGETEGVERTGVESEADFDLEEDASFWLETDNEESFEEWLA